MGAEAQKIPLRMYQSAELIMLAAPMPGLKAEDISVTIMADRVSIRGEERGPGQHDVHLLMDEWTIGPYYREVELPVPVNGPLSNATYGNGVLVLSLPKLKAGEAASSVSFELYPVESARGERVGHKGKEIQPTTTGEHEKKHRS